MKTLERTAAPSAAPADSVAKRLGSAEEHFTRVAREAELARRRVWAEEVRRIREEVTSKYPDQSDSIVLIREDRNR